jgi:hypothetical protein
VKTKKIFDEETDAEILALADMQGDMAYLVNALLEHVDDGEGKPLCGAKSYERDLLVVAGLESDCVDCRAKVGGTGIGNMKDHPQRMPEEWEPQPMEGAETMLAEKQKRCDGR